ncbi:MAG: hypothetical protein K2L72_04615, partial [Clostridia bacterium]|nr:hypothetical protein [Clostridia bacterium]
MANAFGGPRGGIRGGKKAKAPTKTLKRLLKYTFSHYKIATVFVILGVIISSSANAIGSALLAPIVAQLKPVDGEIVADWAVIVRYV